MRPVLLVLPSFEVIASSIHCLCFFYTMLVLPVPSIAVLPVPSTACFFYILPVLPVPSIASSTHCQSHLKLLLYTAKCQCCQYNPLPLSYTASAASTIYSSIYCRGTNHYVEWQKYRAHRVLKETQCTSADHQHTTAQHWELPPATMVRGLSRETLRIKNIFCGKSSDVILFIGENVVSSKLMIYQVSFVV